MHFLRNRDTTIRNSTKVFHIYYLCVCRLLLVYVYKLKFYLAKYISKFTLKKKKKLQLLKHAVIPTPKLDEKENDYRHTKIKIYPTQGGNVYTFTSFSSKFPEHNPFFNVRLLKIKRFCYHP